MCISLPQIQQAFLVWLKAGLARRGCQKRDCYLVTLVVRNLKADRRVARHLHGQLRSEARPLSRAARSASPNLFFSSGGHCYFSLRLSFAHFSAARITDPAKGHRQGAGWRFAVHQFEDQSIRAIRFFNTVDGLEAETMISRLISRRSRRESCVAIDRGAA
jgi:hypothetical protein